MAEILSTHTVDELKVPVGHVIELNGTTQTPIEAFKILLDNHIMSAPVWDESTARYIGFLDLRDLVALVVHSYTHECASLEDAVEHGMSRFIHDVDTGVTLTYLARRHPFIPIKPDATLLQAAKVLTQRSVHRVPVVDTINGKKCCVSIISQSSIIKFLDDCSSELPLQFKSTLADLGIGLKDVVHVKADDTVIKALVLMDQWLLSGIPIVEEGDECKLIANTTPTDLRVMLNFKLLPSLEMHILNFYSKVRQNDHSTNISYPMTCCRHDTTLARVCGILTATHSHRIFIIDENTKLIGVVSFTDILKAIIN